MEVTAQYVLARALDLRVPYSYCLVFHPLVTVVASFPVSVAGLGVREGGYVFLLGLVGVPPAMAFAMGLLWSAVILLGGLGGGAVLLLSRRQGRMLAADADVVGDGRSAAPPSTEPGVMASSSRLSGR